MTESLDEEEVRERNIRAMGAPLGQLYSVLTTELIWQFLQWGQFEQLFGDKPSRVDLLNESAPLFFHVVQDVLWHDTILGITRLVGPATTRVGRSTKQNLSIRRLPAFISDDTLKVELGTLIQGSVQRAQFAFDWRNRFIAHRDLEIALGQQIRPLAALTRLAVNNALDSIAEVLNRINLHYFDASHGFRHSTAPTGAESLLHVIRDGLQVERLRQRRLKAGEYDPDDWTNEMI